MLLAKRGDAPPAVVRCDAEALPFARTFDAVVFSHFLHLVSSLATLGRELRRVLVPGAHLVVVDTSAGPRPATIRVIEIVKAQLDGSFEPWPTGDDSRDRRLLRDLLGHMAGDEVEVVPIDVYPNTTSLREALDDVRARKWWTFRVREAAECARAADAAERRLVEEGADLDARADEPVVVRLLVGRLRG